jgi:hypothetical protein
MSCMYVCTTSINSQGTLYMSLSDFASAGASFREAMQIYKSNNDMRYISTLQDYLGCLKQDPATGADGTHVKHTH